MQATMPMKIGQLAERSGVNLQTVRYYEREGLLPVAPRLASGYRTFSEETLRRLRFIKRAQELGFTLAEIRELLSLRVDPKRDRSEVRAIAKAKIADIDAKMKALAGMKQALESITMQCGGHGRASECPILESIEASEASSVAQA
jgi:MerR family transcriptional regulator, copper efflux regulator